MLSKIKSCSVVTEIARNTALSLNTTTTTTSNASDNEDNELIDNDSNNNNNNNINNNQQTKKTQDELLDIVEISRKRRLSKDSADSLTSFIKWSFSHIDPSIKRLSEVNNRYHHHNYRHHQNHVKVERTPQRDSPSTPTLLLDDDDDDDVGDDDDDDDMLDDRDEDWHGAIDHHQEFLTTTGSNKFHHHQESEPIMLRHHHSKPSTAGGGSSAANLALLDAANERHLDGSGSLSIDELARGLKRPRKQAYSPEQKLSHSSSLGLVNRKSSSSSLGNVVDRLHQQQLQHQQQHQHQQQQLDRGQHEMEQETGGGGGTGNGLSFHLQQFLQQQTSLEDLCSSVGLDDSNQLVLAAAIHRALVDSAGPTGSQNNMSSAQDTKSTASSTGSSSSTGASSKTNNNNNNHSNNLNQSVSDSGSSTASGANSRLMESLDNQRRAYNTRAALHGITPTTVNRQQSTTNTTTTTNNNSNNSNMSMSTRVQQQRHAQAAAALSALANAGSHPALHLTSGATGATPMVDFTCDTCSSSFDDRHRLMQHQSIHLELKKDWFTETPVDEVMKIFNRRRGEFLCNTCNLRFEATFDYDKHNHSVHGQRPYCCQFCGNGTRTFRFWRQYLNHLYDHRYIFSCTIDDCDFTVNRRDSLRFHIFRFHLNCQLPQNQQQQHQQQLRFGHNMLLGNNNNNNSICDSK